MCGIVGVAGDRDAVRKVYLGLYALQHRGQEAAGIVAERHGSLEGRHGLGLVCDALTEASLSGFRGFSAVGHVRYATAGGRGLVNAQPLLFETGRGPIAIAHNGTLTNALTLRRELERRGAIFRTSTDSEVLIHLIARRPGPLEEAISAALRRVQGAYALLFLTPGRLIAARDPRGFRPLSIGRKGGAWAFASETAAFQQIRAEPVREISAGEMVVVEEGRLRSVRSLPTAPRGACCAFEQIYFARPDSNVFGSSVLAARRALGRALAQEMSGVEADIVVAVPDSGLPAAMGFSEESGIPLELGFMRSHYVGRTFIQPAQFLRDHAVRLKLAPVPEALAGRRVVLVDDSIVRGTTSRRICAMLREAGVRRVHLAVSSPPVVSPCFYGIDTPRREELIAASKPLPAIRRFLGVDGLHYLSLPGMLRALDGIGGPGARNECTACFTGEYPTPLADFRNGCPRAGPP
jgi:amidophosphoribosyltransferase